MGTRLNRENLAVGSIGPAHTNEPISGKETKLKINGPVEGSLPAKAPFLLTLEDGTDRYEVVKVTGWSKDEMTVVRGQEGTEAVDHPTPCTFCFGITGQEMANLVGALAK